MDPIRVELPELAGLIIGVAQERWCTAPTVFVRVQPDTLWRRGAAPPGAEVDAITLRFPIERFADFVIGRRIALRMQGVLE